ncbi:helix-hairpin-helix domain-containing protein [Phormidium sp. LEGE 05292]|uniref:ComEA family DNA-binding protein n=1 Tax=[Phormidium] sp. LEGE 05292 TaxID=767427 RepID=UPI001882D881|nr:helix-hairpin-helix domain-containing protein [Phormidium sp. LEGE 05292]MBE9225780.1 helix-hairpin-helix domain-containing protein [Phormidium sp. LEGE 05292]
MKVLRSLSVAVSLVSLIAISACSTTESKENTSTTKVATDTTTTATTNHNGHSSNQAKININNAILSELDKLEAKLGIPALSNKIQASRPYGSIEELVSKQIITQAEFDKIKDMVTIEDVVLTGEAKDVDYMTKLGLMKGHLLVAKELLDQQQPKQAEPHIGHPVEEIYVDVQDQLNERNVKEFKTTLVTLQDLVKSKPKDTKIATEFTNSMQAVDGAIQAIPEAQRNSPQFVLKVMNSLLDAANSEYGAAIANGKISAAIEYQDSRGFVNYANTLYQGIAPQMAKQNPEAHKAIETNMAELSKAWPAAIPPAAPVLTPAQVSQLIKTIEQNSQKITSNG